MSETTLATSYRSVLWTNSRTDAPIATNGQSIRSPAIQPPVGGTAHTGYVSYRRPREPWLCRCRNRSPIQRRSGRDAGRSCHSKDVFGYAPIDVAEHTSTQIRDIWNKELIKWVADETFVLNALQNDNLDEKSPWYGRLDTDRVGAFGHSFGGAASVQVCSVDPRVRSALNLDGSGPSETFIIGHPINRSCFSTERIMVCRTTDLKFQRSGCAH